MCWQEGVDTSHHGGSAYPGSSLKNNSFDGSMRDGVKPGNLKYNGGFENDNQDNKLQDRVS